LQPNERFVLEKGLMTQERLNEAIDPKNMLACQK
jgi:hypothetical protein